MPARAASLISQGAGAALVLMSLSGCVQRTLEFNCVGLSEAELVMTPTSLSFQDRGYSFDTEDGPWRQYRSDSDTLLRFNPTSGELKVAGNEWRCKRYEALLERAATPSRD